MAIPTPNRPATPGPHGLAHDFWAFARDLAGYAGRRGAVAVALVAAGAVVEGLSLALLVPLLVVVIGGAAPAGRLGHLTATVSGRLGLATPPQRLVLLLGAYMALMGVRAVILYLRDIRVAELQIGFVEHRRADLVARLAATSWDRLARLRHARVAHAMSADIQRVGQAANLLLTMVVAAAMMAAQCVLVLLLAPALAATALTLLALAALAYLPVTRRAHSVGIMMTDQNLSLLDTTTQFLGGLKLAIGANLQASFVTEFRDTLNRLTRRQMDFRRQSTKARLALTTLTGLAGGLLVLIGLTVFNVAAATLITLLYIVMRMSRAAGTLQQQGQQLAFALPAYRTITQLTRELAELAPDSAATEAPPALADGPVVFDGVTFVHDAEGETATHGVRGLDVTIAPGEFVGIAGASGAGKTTFADLMVGLYVPQRGRITVAATPLAGAVLKAWRDRVSYVAQDPVLFHDSVRRNLAWANPRASEAEMWQALALADAEALVRGMEHGLDTVVGERGTLVSGGERQRLALARALLRKPRLLILDEATSAIDIAGERAILARLAALTPQLTVIVIAHRGESLAFCSRVLQFADGRVVTDSAAAIEAAQ